MAVIRWDHSTRRSAARASRKLGVALVGYQARGVQVWPSGVGVQVPAPGQGVQPQREGGGALGPLAFPRLGVLPAEVLFDVAEADLDPPAGGVPGDDSGGGGGRVGGEEVVIGLDAVGIAHDHQGDQVGLVDPVPEHVADVDQPGDGRAAHVGLDPAPAPVG